MPRKIPKFCTSYSCPYFVHFVFSTTDNCSLIYARIVDSPQFQDVDDSSSENLTACRILPQYNWPLFQMSFFLMSYLLPLMLICFFYICMLIRLWRTDRVSAESRRGRKRVTRLVFVVVGVFAFCWCPIQVSISSDLSF